jgi:hypothetical protein
LKFQLHKDKDAFLSSNNRNQRRVIDFKVLLQHFSGYTEENCEQPHGIVRPGQSVQ